MSSSPKAEASRLHLEKENDGGSGPYVGQSTRLGTANFEGAGSGSSADPYSAAIGTGPAVGPTLADAGTRKLVSALLAIFLGTLGLHKFYLGYTGAGLVLLLVNLGGWFVTFLLSIITLGLASIFLLPLMTLVSSVIAVCTIIEGVVYLSKTDADFYQTYLAGKREWF